MDKITLQIQSIIYKNPKESIFSALDNLEIAIKIAKKEVEGFSDVLFIYGDSSPVQQLSDKDVEEISNRYKDAFSFKYQYFNKNTGTALGHNILAEGCEQKYIMIMNPDVKVSPHFFRHIFKFFKEKKDCGLVEARQTPIEHQKEYNVKTFETDWAATACCVFPTEVFNKVKGFDNNSFFMYCDDLDFSWRIRLFLKLKIYYSPLAVVYHAKTLSVTGSWQPTDAEKYYSAEAAIFMAHKWSNPRRCKKLCFVFSNSSDPQLKKAAETFLKRKKDGTLPTPIDKTHKVARFYGDYYSKNRFIL